MNYKLNINDVEFVTFRKGRGPGGQNKNKTATSIRAVHVPTGIKVESSKERSLEANKKAAIKILQDRLDQLKKEKSNAVKQEIYSNKEDSAFGSQIRTYRMVGNAQGVLDHRTRVSHPDVKSVLNGDIDRFLKR